MISKEKQLAALRSMLDGIYIDAEQSHSLGTVPCDLTIIFTGLASLTVSYDEAKEDISALKADVACLTKQVSDLVTILKVNDASNQTRREIIVALFAFATGSIGLLIGTWFARNWINLMKLV